jgi:hypothetical protein
MTMFNSYVKLPEGTEWIFLKDGLCHFENVD